MKILYAYMLDSGLQVFVIGSKRLPKVHLALVLSSLDQEEHSRPWWQKEEFKYLVSKRKFLIPIFL